MKKIITILLFCGPVQAFSQNIPNVQTPCTTASQGTAGNFIISYTIGEMPLIQSWQTSSIFITQGVIQPLVPVALQRLIKIPDSAANYFSQSEIKVYPNPTPGIFSLQLFLKNKGKVKTNLFDAAGKLLQVDELEYNTFISKQYNIASLANGIYFLQLLFTEPGSSTEKEMIYTIQKNK
jgi:Secretion system C-terminal sorting domain